LRPALVEDAEILGFQVGDEAALVRPSPCMGTMTSFTDAPNTRCRRLFLLLLLRGQNWHENPPQRQYGEKAATRHHAR